MSNSGPFGDYFDDHPVVPTSHVPAMVAGRYEIGARLGAGSYSVVHRAVDRFSGDPVAVKFLNTGTTQARVRREAVALRALRLPGVVYLLDEGSEQGRAFLVMEIVDGAPFPSARLPASWRELRDVTGRLLCVLGRVHAAGALHLDLKPANVRVTPSGAVVLLDLGLAGGPALGGAAPAQCTAGSIAYMAPEQFTTGDVDARSDLYSVGVMLYEALTGALPDRDLVMAGGLSGDHIPSDIRAPLMAVLSPAPHERPRSAWELMAMLGVAHLPVTSMALLSDSAAVLSPEQLAACFHGPERLFHLPSDAAARLHRCTGGDRRRVSSELRSWLRSGIAELDGQRLRISRDAIEQLDALGEQADASRGDALPGAAIDAALNHLDRGHVERARAILEQALLLMRREDISASAEQALLTVWVQLAFEERTPGALDLALYQVGRAVHQTPDIVALDSLLRSAWHAARREPERAQTLLDGLSSFADPELEVWRYAVRLQVAALRGTEERIHILDEAQAWSRESGIAAGMARVLGWRARLSYEQGDFVEAAMLSERAAEQTPRSVDRLSSFLNSASAWLEAGEHVRTRVLAGRALQTARQLRHPFFEARAEWMLRSVAYRAGEHLVPDTELVEAAAYLDVKHTAGLIALNEAAIAWRNRDLSLGEQLAGLARHYLAAAQLREARVLARALELTCVAQRVGMTPSREEQFQELARDVLSHPIVDVDWQVLGMLAQFPGGDAWRDSAIGLARKAPRPGLRRELLAPNEVLRGRVE